MHSTRESALAFVAGKKVDEIVALGEEIYDEEMSDKIWRGHPRAGPAAPRRRPAGVAGDRDAGRAGDDHRRPARADRCARHGRRVGRRRVHRPAGRRRAARRGQGRRGARSGRARGPRPRSCSAYSDSINDLPMLSLVGRPVAVNPDSALRAEAKRRGWEIRDFRTGRKAARIGIPAALGAGARGRRRGGRRRDPPGASPQRCGPPPRRARASAACERGCPAAESAPDGPALHEQPVQRALDRSRAPGR